jgi:hypothetical protein
LRRITWCAAGSLILAASALAVPLSASQASVSKTPVRHAWPRPLLPRPPSVEQTTGIISGVVRSAGGAPASGVCVTALGHAARAMTRTGPDGRYLLGGLRPGQYRITVAACASASRPSSQAAIGAYWTSGPASVTVSAGKIINPAPISTLYLDFASLTGSAHQTLSAGAIRAKRGSISGRVTGYGRPLRGVCAVAVPVRGNSESIALTGKAGRYRIARLRPGRYYVAFIAGFPPLCPNKGNWLTQVYPGVNSQFVTRKAKAVRVRAGRDTVGIDGHLKEGGEISGTVHARSGKPVSGICVDVSGTFQGGLEVDYILGTNKAGQYAAHGLFPSGYQVQFSIGCGTKGNYAGQWWRHVLAQFRASTINITGTRRVTGINATLLPGASVSGIVRAVNADGKPLRRVCAATIDQTDFNAQSITGRNGRYRLIGLSAGPLTIQFDPTCVTGTSIYQPIQRSITLSTGQVVTGFNAYLALGGGISGVVTDTRGRPVGGVCVAVNDVNDFARTRTNGRYSLSGVPTGSFQVAFFGGCGNTGSVAPQFYPNSPTSLLAKLVRFRPNTITPKIDATMQPGGTLAGAVTDTAGRRLSRICVDAGTPQQPLFAFSDLGGAITANGKYLISNLAPGAYDLSFGCGGYGAEFFPSQVNPAAAGVLSVNGGATTMVSVTRLSRAGAISGTVTSKAGAPVPSACVQAAPADGRKAFFPVGFASANQHGHYRIGGLAPARYLVQFIDCSGTLAPRWYRRAPTEAHAMSVKVLPGHTDAGINAVMTAGGTITGRVIGPTGKPASNVCVTAFSQQAQDTVFSQTGRSGRYRVAGLSTGGWSMNFAPCSPTSDLASVNRPGTVRVTAPPAVTSVNIRLPVGGSASGRITSHIGDRALGGVCVLLLPVKASHSIGFAVTDNHGRYVAPQLEAGDYRAYIGDPSCNEFPDAVPPFAPQWYNEQPRQATAKVIHVSAGGTATDVNGALAPFAAVTGTVDTRRHAPVSGECVTAVPFRAAPDPDSGFPAEREVAVTSRTGGYTLTALLPGRYKIEFSSGCGGGRFAIQWWRSAGSARSAKVITVGFATITGIDATLRH